MRKKIPCFPSAPHIFQLTSVRTLLLRSYVIESAWRFSVKEQGKKIRAMIENEKGRIGYLIAWLFGVPASLLFVIFLIRGH